jgi:hypothetical protein
MAMTSRGLVLLDKASQLLAKATTFDEVKEVRDEAEAARTLAKAAKLGLDLQNRAAEVKLRAERKAGAFLKELGLRGGDRRSKSHRVALKLEDLGVTKRQSELWQLAASVPDEDFEKYVRGKNQLGQEVTASGLLRIAKSLRLKIRVDRRHPCSVPVRGELLAVVSELKSQCGHLSNLLEPLVDGQFAAYKSADRRFIARLTREMGQVIEELEKHLWKRAADLEPTRRPISKEFWP